ncbi:hypothetical protein AURDEDRAFT_166851 [Auricularia subglabra TFB-10046 SS5]|nr:hypothetical protein AURDEDRAFT_166851 [Auricularia subglabra TFB-10046 SS5]
MRFAVLASVLFAAMAAAAPAPGGGTASACKGGDAYCCNNVNPISDNSTGDTLPVPIALILNAQCTPITLLAIVLQTQCAGSTVCCQNAAATGDGINMQCGGLAI